MSLEKIHLRKLLVLFGLSPQRRAAMVRADARAEIRKRIRKPSGGNDFHSCFWSDAKIFSEKGGDLMLMTRSRVGDSKARARLYPALADGYLNWWNEKRRWINEPIEVIPEGVRAPYSFQEIGGTVKVENLLALKIGNDHCRLIYPYFSETPILSEDTARLGLWLMSKAFPKYSVEDMRVLDVLRGQAFAVDRHPLSGNEGAIFVERYARMLSDWRELIKQFGEG